MIPAVMGYVFFDWPEQPTMGGINDHRELESIIPRYCDSEGLSWLCIM